MSSAAKEDDPPKKKETALQKETRLTGNPDLLSYVEEQLGQLYRGTTVNRVLARKVIGKFCQSKTAQDFDKKIKDYVSGETYISLAFFKGIEREVAAVDHRREHGSTATTTTLAGSDGTGAKQAGGLMLSRKFLQKQGESDNNNSGSNLGGVANDSGSGGDAAAPDLASMLFQNRGNANRNAGKSLLGLQARAKLKQQGQDPTRRGSMGDGIDLGNPNSSPRLGANGGGSSSSWGVPASSGPVSAGLLIGGKETTSMQLGGGSGAGSSLSAGINLDLARKNPLHAGDSEPQMMTMSSSAGNNSKAQRQPKKTIDDEDEHGLNLNLTQGGGKYERYRGPREVDSFMKEADREDADVGNNNAADEGEDGGKRKRGGGIRVFKGNKKTIMREDNLEEPAKKLDGLQHDVLDEEFQRKLENEVAMDEMDEQALERAWYESEEGGAAAHQVEEMGEKELWEREAKMKKQQEEMQTKRMTLLQKERLAEREAWDESRLHAATGGKLGKKNDVVTGDIFKDNYNSASKATILVRETVPPFLDGRITYTTQTEMVNVVRDPTSDMATLAKKGSAVVAKVREEDNRQKMRKRFWEVAGSQMGQVLGVENQAEQAEKREEDAERKKELGMDDNSNDKSENENGGSYSSNSASENEKGGEDHEVGEDAKGSGESGAEDSEKAGAVGEGQKSKEYQPSKEAAAEKSKEGSPAGEQTAARRASQDSSSSKNTGKFDYKADSKFANTLATQKFGGQSEFSKTKTLDEQRKSLPVYKVRDQFLHLLNEHQIVVAVGETGSGKTTQLAQYLLEHGYGGHGMIGCTQPRRVAAMSVAKRVAEERNCELGGVVGYSIRFEDCTSQETKIKFMTDGVLLRETLLDKDIDKYSCIIMDEAHERALNTDVLFGILKAVTTRRYDFRLIVTSATLDSDRFSNFFGGVPVFQIPGRTFPVDTFFQKSPCQDYVDAAVTQAIQIHVQQGTGDILIFMTGQEDIEATCCLLADRLEEVGQHKVPPLTILPIYSQMPSDLQAKIFQPSKARKVIVATNIAETSLTVDGVKFVIDSGYAKVKVYDPRIGMDSLLVTPISQANANQRQGRAGRTGPGMCWRIYTERAFVSEMHEMNIPEIQRTNLSNVVLLLKSLGVKNLLDFDFMDPPPQDTILNSLYQLWMLGALDNLGDLTHDGRRMSQFPLDPPLSKMLLSSEKLSCSAEMLIIVSMLSVENIFYRAKGREEEADAAREKFSVPESDHLTLLHVFNQWKRAGYNNGWCTDHFLHHKQLKKVREVHGQLHDIMVQNKIKILSTGLGDWDVIRKAICSGYFHNAARMRGIGEYVNLRSSVPANLHPQSSLYGLGYTPDYIVYHEILLTTKEYMSKITAVEPTWLAEMGPMFFSLRGGPGGAGAAETDAMSSIGGSAYGGYGGSAASSFGGSSNDTISSLRRNDRDTQKRMEFEAKLKEDADRQMAEEERKEQQRKMQAAGKNKQAVLGGLLSRKKEQREARERARQERAGEIRGSGNTLSSIREDSRERGRRRSRSRDRRRGRSKSRDRAEYDEREAEDERDAGERDAENGEKNNEIGNIGSDIQNLLPKKVDDDGVVFAGNLEANEDNAALVGGSSNPSSKETEKTGGDDKKAAPGSSGSDKLNSKSKPARRLGGKSALSFGSDDDDDDEEVMDNARRRANAAKAKRPMKKMKIKFG